MIIGKKLLVIVVTISFLLGVGTGLYFGYNKGFGEGHWSGIEQGQRTIMGLFGFHEAPRGAAK